MINFAGPYGGGNPDMVLKKQKGNLSPHQLKSIKPIQENMEDDERGNQYHALLT